MKPYWFEEQGYSFVIVSCFACFENWNIRNQPQHAWHRSTSERVTARRQKE
jgi:hypothetical protein